MPPPSMPHSNAARYRRYHRAAAILRLLGRSAEPVGVQFIARALNIIPSTCLHILRTLVAEEFVAVDPVTKLYTLNAGVLILARQWLSQNRLTDIAQPSLDRIVADYGVTAIGVQIVGLEHMIVVAMARSESMIQLYAQIGSRFPATISASGRCIAAFGDYEREELQRRFSVCAGPTHRHWPSGRRRSKRRGSTATRSTRATTWPGSPSPPRRSTASPANSRTASSSSASASSCAIRRWRRSAANCATARRRSRVSWVQAERQRSSAILRLRQV